MAEKSGGEGGWVQKGSPKRKPAPTVFRTSLKPIAVPSDGACAFHSLVVTDAANGDDREAVRAMTSKHNLTNYSAVWRRKVVDYLREHPDSVDRILLIQERNEKGNLRLELDQALPGKLHEALQQATQRYATAGHDMLPMVRSFLRETYLEYIAGTGTYCDDCMMAALAKITGKPFVILQVRYDIEFGDSGAPREIDGTREACIMEIAPPRQTETGFGVAKYKDDFSNGRELRFEPGAYVFLQTIPGDAVGQGLAHYRPLIDERQIIGKLTIDNSALKFIQSVPGRRTAAHQPAQSLNQPTFPQSPATPAPARAKRSRQARTPDSQEVRSANEGRDTPTSADASPMSGYESKAMRMSQESPVDKAVNQAARNALSQVVGSGKNLPSDQGPANLKEPGPAKRAAACGELHQGGPRPSALAEINTTVPTPQVQQPNTVDENGSAAMDVDNGNNKGQEIDTQQRQGACKYGKFGCRCDQHGGRVLGWKSPDKGRVRVDDRRTGTGQRVCMFQGCPFQRNHDAENIAAQFLVHLRKEHKGQFGDRKECFQEFMGYNTSDWNDSSKRKGLMPAYICVHCSLPYKNSHPCEAKPVGSNLVEKGKAPQPNQDSSNSSSSDGSSANPRSSSSSSPSVVSPPKKDAGTGKDKGQGNRNTNKLSKDKGGGKQPQAPKQPAHQAPAQQPRQPPSQQPQQRQQQQQQRQRHSERDNNREGNSEQDQQSAGNAADDQRDGGSGGEDDETDDDESADHDDPAVSTRLLQEPVDLLTVPEDVRTMSEQLTAEAVSARSFKLGMPPRGRKFDRAMARSVNAVTQAALVGDKLQGGLAKLTVLMPQIILCAEEWPCERPEGDQDPQSPQAPPGGKRSKRGSKKQIKKNRAQLKKAYFGRVFNRISTPDSLWTTVRSALDVIINRKDKIYDHESTTTPLRRQEQEVNGPMTTLEETEQYYEHLNSRNDAAARIINLAKAGEFSRACSVANPKAKGILEVDHDILSQLKQLNPSPTNTVPMQDQGERMDTSASGPVNNQVAGEPERVSPPDQQGDTPERAASPSLLSPPVVQPATVPPILLSEKEVCEAVRSTLRLSASGRSGWSREFTYPMLTYNEFRRTFTTLINAVARGDMPEDLKPFLYGGRIVPLDKGKGRVRPIVVGEFLVKVAGKALLTKTQSVLAEKFKKEDQMGVAVKGGSELMIHSIRTLLEANKSFGVLKVDFANAYNTISRRLIREALLSETWTAPLLTYFDAHYPILEGGERGNAQYPRLAVTMCDGSTAWIDSQEGVHQGDPLGPTFFAFGLSKVLSEARRTMGVETTSRIYSPSYLDDLYGTGVMEDLVRFDLAIRQAAQTTGSGLVVNGQKCQLYFKNSDGHADRAQQKSQAYRQVGRPDNDQPTLVIPREGIDILGAPVGDDEWVEAQLRSKVDDTRGILNSLADTIDNPQILLLLIRFCAAPRVTHLMRTAVGATAQTAYSLHDRAIEQSLSRLISDYLPGSDPDNFALSDLQKMRASLPLILGGLGLQRAEWIGPIAIMASSATALPRMMRHATIRHLLGLEPLGERAPSTGLVEMEQFDARFRELMSNSAAGSQQGDAVMRQVWSPSTTWSIVQSLPKGLTHVWQKWEQAQGSEQRVQGLRARFKSSQIDALVGSAQRTTGDLITHSAATPGAKYQSTFTTIYHSAMFALALENTSPDLRAELVSQTQPGASDWLNCTPFTPFLQLRPEAYAWNIQKWTGGVTEYDANSVCACVAGAAQKAKPGHEANCRFGGGLQLRHDRVVKLLASVLHKAGYEVEREARAQYAQMGKGGPDITIGGLSSLLQQEFIEVAVTNPNTHAAARSNALAGARAREQSKEAKYESKAAASGMRIRSAVMETTGAMGVKMTDLLRQAIRKMTRDGRSLVPDTASWMSSRPLPWLRQRFSVVMRDSAFELAKRSHEKRETVPAKPTGTAHIVYNPHQQEAQNKGRSCDLAGDQMVVDDCEEVSSLSNGSPSALSSKGAHSRR